MFWSEGEVLGLIDREPRLGSPASFHVLGAQAQNKRLTMEREVYTQMTVRLETWLSDGLIGFILLLAICLILLAFSTARLP